jgi:phenylalanyl-tRNA synthetase beta subunit
VDLIEEISRIYGYDNIEPRSKRVALSPVHQDRHIDLHYRVKQTLSTGFGMSEVHTYCWYDKEWNRAIGHEDECCLKIINPGISKYDTLRRHMVPNLLATERRNEGFYDEFRLFEVGSVYHPVREPDDQSVAGCGVVEGGNARSALQTYLNIHGRAERVGDTRLCRSGVSERVEDISLNRSGDTERIENTHLCCIVHWKGRSSQKEDESIDLLKQAASAVARVMCNRPAEFGSIDPEAQSEAHLSWMHPVKRCSVSCGGVVLGYITMINPHLLDEFDQKANMALMEINLSALDGVETVQLSFKEPPRYPQVNLDFSLLVDRSRTYDSLLQELDGFSHELLRSISYVDTYSGPSVPTGKKSVTVAITIASDSHTLSSDEINDFSSCFVKWLETHGMSLR